MVDKISSVANDGVSRHVTARVRRERQRTRVWNEEQGGAKRSAELETFHKSEMNGSGNTGAAEEIVRCLFGGPDRKSKRPRRGA